MTFRPLLVLLVPLVLFSSTSIAEDHSESAESPIVLRPGAVLIEIPGWPNGEEQTRQVFLAAAAAAVYDNAKFNENFREPTNGVSPHPVNCQQAESLALTFIAGWRQGERSTSSMKLRFDWQHDTIDGRRGRDKDFVTNRDAFSAYDSVKERSRPVYVASLSLIKRHEKRKVDGTWTLTISFRGDELHREVFELTACNETT